MSAGEILELPLANFTVASQIAANKAEIETNQQAIAAHKQRIEQSESDIEANTKRFTALADYDVKCDWLVFANFGGGF